jgi:hypothetical protein
MASTDPASKLTRLDTSVALPSPVTGWSYDDLGKDYADGFWNLFYDPGTAGVFDDLENTPIEWCWVRPTVSKGLKIPLIGSLVSLVITSLNNVGWTAPYLVYSFTEDWDHNGRIDHIRVQSAAPIDPDFSAFYAEVDGYNVKGYKRPPDPANPFYKYLFFIELEEKDYSDTDKTPLLREITGVKDSSGRPFSLLDSAETPIDTAPPQVVYSLALPGGNEIFIRMSEPVEFDASFNPASLVMVNGKAGSYAIDPVTSYAFNRLLEFKITNIDPASLTVADIAGVKDFVFMPPSLLGCFYDSPGSFSYPPRIGASQLSDCYFLWPKDRKYEYGNAPDAYADKPPSWSVTPVSEARKNSNVNNGSVPAYDYTHRLSDLLVAPSPSNASDPFFVLPVYAHDLTGAANTDLRTRIFEFDGSKELMDMEVTIQAKLSGDAAGIGRLELRYGSDKRIPEEFRSKEALHGMNGLWLPDSPGNAAAALVPRPYGNAGVSPGNPAPGGNLYNFVIPAADLLSYSSVEFYFTAKGGPLDLIVARLDAGASLPWFRRVKPFSFRLREMVSQRGGATILNNVINPDRGDSAVLQYVLTRSGRVTIQVFTLDGNLVRVLERSSRAAGEYAVSWDGRNSGGRGVARGLYFIRIVGPDIDEIRKVMVVK